LSIFFTHEASSMLSSVALRPRGPMPPPKRRTAVQLTLALLESPSPPATVSVRLDPEAHAAALEFLARMIAQALDTTRREEDRQ